MELSQEDIKMLLSIIERVSIQGTDGMKMLLELKEKLIKGIESDGNS